MKNPTAPTSDSRVPAWVVALERHDAVLRAALDGDALHWGLWPQERPGLPLEAAQEALLERLGTLLPSAPATVRVEGWGLGTPAAWLACHGYRVLAVGGSAARIAYARARHRNEGLHFQDSDPKSGGTPSEPVDAVLALEPCWVAWDSASLAEWAAAALPPGGRLVLATRVARLAEGEGRIPSTAQLATALAEAGFVLLDREELDGAVAPTAERLLGRIEARRRPIEDLLGDTGVEAVEQVLAEWRRRAEALRSGLEGYELWSCRRDEIRVRAYREGDEHRILPLFEGVFYQPRSLEHWAWKYRDHPLGGLRIAVATAPDGDLAAHFAAYPVRFRSTTPDLADCDSMQAGDTMTHPAYRRKGLGRSGLLSRLAHYYYDRFCIGRVPFIYGFNTGTIRTLGERYLGYEYLPPLEVASVPAAGLRRSLVRRVSDRLAGWTVGRLTTAGPEHDRFFEAAAPAYGFLVQRDAAWLRWRYLECPDAVHHLFEVRRRGELAGWAAFRRDGDTLRWGDAMFRRDRLEAVAVLLSSVLHTLGRTTERVSGWLAPHPPWWREHVLGLGFTLAPEPNGLAPVFKRFDSTLTVEVIGRSLYLTEGDSDLF